MGHPKLFRAGQRSANFPSSAPVVSLAGPRRRDISFEFCRLDLETQEPSLMLDDEVVMG